MSVDILATELAKCKAALAELAMAKTKLEELRRKNKKLVVALRDCMSCIDVDNLTMQANYRDWEKVLRDAVGKPSADGLPERGKAVLAEDVENLTIAPCDHSSRYWYSGDDGKHLRCLLCQETKLEELQGKVRKYFNAVDGYYVGTAMFETLEEEEANLRAAVEKPSADGTPEAEGEKKYCLCGNPMSQYRHKCVACSTKENHDATNGSYK